MARCIRLAEVGALVTTVPASARIAFSSAPLRGVVVTAQVADLSEQVQEVLLDGLVGRELDAIEPGLAEVARLGEPVELRVAVAEVEEGVDGEARGAARLEDVEGLVDDAQPFAHAVEGEEAPTRSGLAAFFAKHPTGWMLGAAAVVFVLLGVLISSGAEPEQPAIARVIPLDKSAQ